MPRSPTHAATNNDTQAACGNGAGDGVPGSTACGLANDSSRRGAKDIRRDPAAGVMLLIVAILVVMTLLSALQSPAESPADVSYRIDVNTAHIGELQLLPNVGPALARRIIEERESGGPFTSAEDMRRVSGVGPTLSARFADYVRFSDADPQ